jgi:hypothetical protein
MYRSSLIQKGKPFYDGSLLHEDTEKCMQILESWDFGFVHQVLSFLRVDDQSLSGGVRDLQPRTLDYYIIVRRYAPVFFGTEEASDLTKRAKRDYYRVLAREALKLRKEAFWRYHQEGLRTLGETVDWPYLILQVIWETLSIVANPGAAIARVFRAAKHRSKRNPSHAQHDVSLERYATTNMK